jgi:hypothetical protein
VADPAPILARRSAWRLQSDRSASSLLPARFRALTTSQKPEESIMTKLTSVALFTLALAGTSALFAQAPAAPATPAGVPPPPRTRVSPHDTITTSVGERGDSRRISLTYGRPYSAKGGQGEARKIWGGLVPWDKADRLGSDEATLLITPVPLVIGATTIPAGAYTLYIVPSETGATKLAFSSNIAKWGIPVDEKHDVARVDLIKSTLEKSVDQLTLTFEREGTSDRYALHIWWETTKFSLPFTVKKA